MENVTLKNINLLVEDNLDLLSINIDEDDLWIWKEIKAKPRVVVIEYNSTYRNKSITQPYLNHPRIEKHPDWLYHGGP